jgi:Flp pilus assembly protein TadB
MPDVWVVGGAVSAGLLFGGALWIAGEPEMADWLARSRSSVAELVRISRFRLWLNLSIERAGWRESPERVAVLAVSLASSMALIAAVVNPLLIPLALAGGLALFLLALNSSIDARRRRLAGELVPLLELFTLELSAGGSALAALGSVAVQVEGDLAANLRRMLIASQVAGSASFEARLTEYSERAGLIPLGSLATILAASREFGTGATQGVRALATDLRRAQRRQLIAHSRRALNHVLLPAAVGVLLPFLAVLMFPAVSVLQRSLR